MRRQLLTLAGLLLWPAVAAGQPAYVVQYYHTDALGSVRAVTNQQGTVIENGRHDFMPFGEEVNPVVPPPDKRLFTGKERDQETGLDYFEARYLAPTEGASRQSIQPMTTQLGLIPNGGTATRMR